MTGMTTTPPGSWTARICRGQPGAGDLAELITARGATVIWCGPDCDCGQDESEDEESP